MRELQNKHQDRETNRPTVNDIKGNENEKKRERERREREREREKREREG
jgi:hypothetical protein